MKPAREAEAWPERRKRAWTGCAKGARAMGEVSRTQPTDEVRGGFTVSAGMATRSSLVISARTVTGNSGAEARLELT